jgi:hypothetical protein
MGTIDTLNEAIEGVTFKRNNDVLKLLDKVARSKSSTPFSERLNEWIHNWYNTIQGRYGTFIFVDEDDFNPEDIEATFEWHKQRYKDTGKIHIWNGASDNNIFGSTGMNLMFRAWHDYTHITNDLGYSFLDESITAEMQQAQLPADWLYEKKLVHCEIVGQAMYFMKNDRFAEDQRSFTQWFLRTPLVALNAEEL